MKALKEFVQHFSRQERIGFSILSFLLIALLGYRVLLAFRISEKPESSEERRLAAIYSEWSNHRNESIQSSPSINKQEIPLFYFDPNTLDSAGFIRLGMPVRAVHGLLNWRRKGKIFRKGDDLAPLYNLPPDLFARLKPFIRIEQQPATAFHKESASYSLPKIIELNTADSALLDRAVAGIGPVLAHKIVARRDALGGFIRWEQLMEIYRFPDSTFRNIKARITLDPGKIKPLDLNGADEATLSRHPYLGPQMAKYILLYRQGIGHYSHFEQLREVPLMSEEIYRKIAPYFIIK